MSVQFLYERRRSIYPVNEMASKSKSNKNGQGKNGHGKVPLQARKEVVMEDVRHFTKAVEEGIDNIRERVDKARDRIEELTDKAKIQSEEAWKDTVKYVQKYPAQSLGLAVVVGAALGVLLFGRRRE